jgi:putative peptidoglycan lipid II flippase
LVDCVAGTLAAVLFLITLLGMVLAPLLVMVFAPGFIDTPGQFDLTSSMLRIVLPYTLFISLTAFAGGILNSYGRFAVPAFTPVFLNLAIIGAAFWLAPRLAQPITALAWGVAVAGVVQLGFQLPFLLRLGLLPKPKLDPGHPGVKRILKMLGPAIFGASVAQINFLISTLIASFLAAGSVSWLYYADRLVEFPLGVFGIALATVILPHLSEKHAQGAVDSFSNMLDWGLRWTVLIGTPAALGLALLARPLICTLFQYGEFSATDMEMTSRSLMAYSLGLLAFLLIKVLAPAYYSRQNIQTPMRIGVWAMCANLLMNLVLVFPLAHAGLALATSLASCLNAWWLYRGLRREGIYQPEAGWSDFLPRVTIANLIMAAFLMGFSGEPGEWLSHDGLARATRLAGLVVGGAGLYLAALWLLGLRWKHMIVSKSTV